ncbi:MAG: hypothetical protein ACOZAO_05465 [Patescibacteria group bacterium]
MKNHFNQQGQVLLFVVATMAIALAVGTAVSLRTLSSVSRITSTDTYSRLIAAAEGGLERYLRLSSVELDNLTGTCSNFDTTACVVTFNPEATETVTAVAAIVVERFGNTTAGNFFDIPIPLEENQTFEVSLTTYSSSSVEVCWAGEPSGTDTDLYVIAYNNSGEITKTGISCSGSCDTGFGSDKSGFINASPSSNSNYDHCANVSLPSNPVGIRIRSIAGDSHVGLRGSSGLPYQGHRIRARASLQGATIENEAVKEATVFKFLPHLPSMFDHSLYSDEGSLTSN